jgi:hypothetical protein
MEIIAQADTSKDGTICIQEFKAIFQRATTQSCDNLKKELGVGAAFMNILNL